MLVESGNCQNLGETISLKEDSIGGTCSALIGVSSLTKQFPVCSGNSSNFLFSCGCLFCPHLQPPPSRHLFPLGSLQSSFRASSAWCDVSRLCFLLRLSKNRRKWLWSAVGSWSHAQLLLPVVWEWPKRSLLLANLGLKCILFTWWTHYSFTQRG